MNRSLYLQRINYQESLELNKTVLFQLQKKHLLAIPFENLDIHWDNKINLKTDEFFQKVVLNKRGGFCYELNGLFYELLKGIGFDVKLISGRVHVQENSYGMEFDHLAIIATVDDIDYLVDVGFGKFSLEPLTLKIDYLLSDKFGHFQFDHFDENYLRINEVVDGKLVPQYIFNTQERKLSDFEEMCHYHQTSSESHFTKKMVISIPTPKGRITLNNHSLKISIGEKTEEIQFQKYEEFELYLLKYFNIASKKTI